MSEPQGPDQQWSPGEPAQQPPGSEEGTAQVGWQEPAYAPTQYAQPQPYPGPPQFPHGQEFGQQPTQYAQPGQPGQPGQSQPPQYGQPGYGQPGQFTPPAGPYGEVSYGQAGAAKASRSSVAIIGVIVGAVVLIVIAAVVVTGLWWPGWFYVTTKLDVNEAQKRRLGEKVVAEFGEDLGGRRFAVWGLAFKPRTDDMREAPALVVIEELLQAGAKCRVHDPEALENARKIFGDRVTYHKTNYEALKGARGPGGADRLSIGSPPVRRECA